MPGGEKRIIIHNCYNHLFAHFIEVTELCFIAAYGSNISPLPLPLMERAIGGLRKKPALEK